MYCLRLFIVVLQDECLLLLLWYEGTEKYVYTKFRLDWLLCE